MKIAVKWIIIILLSPFVIFIPMVYRLLKIGTSYLRIKESKKIRSYLRSLEYKNLKSEYFFIDHAIDEYDSELSMISLSNESNFREKIENNEKIYNYIDKARVCEAIEKIEKDISKKDLNNKCIGLGFLMHNRDQRRQFDEAHWLRIKCIEINNSIRLMSTELSKELNCIATINQPETINNLLPLISLVQFYCLLVISNKKQIGCLYDQVNRSYSPYKIIPIDRLFDSSQKEYSIQEAKDFVLHELNTTESSIISIKFTDLGIDGGVLSIFTEIEVMEASKDSFDAKWLDYEEFCKIGGSNLPSQLFLFITKILYNQI
jgi:hypothetical protein